MSHSVYEGNPDELGARYEGQCSCSQGKPHDILYGYQRAPRPPSSYVPLATEWAGVLNRLDELESQVSSSHE